MEIKQKIKTIKELNKEIERYKTMQKEFRDL
jgi:hypothetical protein